MTAAPVGQHVLPTQPENQLLPRDDLYRLLPLRSRFARPASQRFQPIFLSHLLIPPPAASQANRVGRRLVRRLNQQNYQAFEEQPFPGHPFAPAYPHAEAVVWVRTERRHRAAVVEIHSQREPAECSERQRRGSVPGRSETCRDSIWLDFQYQPSRGTARCREGIQFDT